MSQSRAPDQALSREARLLRMYRARPDLWVEHKIDIDLARCRGKGELEAWLAGQPGERHQWAREHLARGDLQLGKDRSYQAEQLRRMASPGRYALRWANAAAKTTTLALFVLWMLDNWPGSAVATTAGTWTQIKDQLWREIPLWAHRALDRDFVVQRVSKTAIDLGSKWFAVARAAGTEATFEGIHADRVLLIFDEGKAIGSDIYDAARRILRGTREWWWVVASTPGSPEGPFHDACTSRLWDVSRLSAYETERISLDQIHADAEELGERSPLFQSMVLGEFPDEGEDTVLPLSMVESIVMAPADAQAVVKRAREYGYEDRAGIDVARFGGDESVIVRCCAGVVRELRAWRGRRLTDTSRRCVEALHDWGILPGYTGVDDVGMGGSVTDHLWEAGLQPLPLNNGTPATQPLRYRNWITEAWFGYRDLCREGLAAIPNDPRLINQLASRRYTVASNGTLQVEGKPHLRARGIESPDRAEAVMYATGSVKDGLGGFYEEVHLPASGEEMGAFAI